MRCFKLGRVFNDMIVSYTWVKGDVRSCLRSYLKYPAIKFWTVWKDL